MCWGQRDSLTPPKFKLSSFQLSLFHPIKILTTSRYSPCLPLDSVLLHSPMYGFWCLWVNQNCDTEHSLLTLSIGSSDKYQKPGCYQFSHSWCADIAFPLGSIALKKNQSAPAGLLWFNEKKWPAVGGFSPHSAYRDTKESSHWLDPVWFILVTGQLNTCMQPVRTIHGNRWQSKIWGVTIWAIPNGLLRSEDSCTSGILFGIDSTCPVPNTDRWKHIPKRKQNEYEHFDCAYANQLIKKAQQALWSNADMKWKMYNTGRNEA